MAELYKTYAESDKVQFVSISVDPQNDSLAVLQDYAKKFGVTDSRWSFLHAPLDSVKQLSEKGFLLSGELPGMHSTKFVLIDDQARVRGYFNYEDGMSIKVLKTQIRQLALKN
jgi:protein SCO1/2